MLAWDDVQQGWSNLTQGVAQGAANIGNAIHNSTLYQGVTATAQNSLEYYADLAVQGQQEGGFWGGAKQVGGWTGGLLSSLATRDNLDKTALTLAGGLAIARAGMIGLQGFGLGSGASVVRQGLEIAQGTRRPEDFSFGEVGLTGLAGGLLGPSLLAKPLLAGTLAIPGLVGGAYDMFNGKPLTGIFDFFTSAIPFLPKGGGGNGLQFATAGGRQQFAGAAATDYGLLNGASGTSSLGSAFQHFLAMSEQSGESREPKIKPGESNLEVFRGTRRNIEAEIVESTGYLLSDAARIRFRENGGDVKEALEYAKKIHEKWLNIWGNENDYAQAHGHWGNELPREFGLDRTFISVTSDPSVTSTFGKIRFGGALSRSDLVPQTIPGAGEQEYLIRYGTNRMRIIE